MNLSTPADELLLSATAAATAAEPQSPVAAAPDTDHGLLEAARAGDEAAFAELVRRYRHQITNYIYRITGSYDVAVDLAQETFMRLYRALDRYQASYAFSTYIYRIATNLAISELRRQRRRRLISLSALLRSRNDEVSEECQLVLPDVRPLQDAALVREERCAAVRRAIATLPDKYRAPLVLRDVEERSYEEIAQILEMNEGTVKSRISRARAFLRDKLEAYL